MAASGQYLADACTPLLSPLSSSWLRAFSDSDAERFVNPCCKELGRREHRWRETRAALSAALPAPSLVGLLANPPPYTAT